MKINNILILFLMIVLLSISGFSYSFYQNWGNGEIQTGSCKNWLWTSCYPQNDLSLNFSSSIEVNGLNSYEPTIWYNMLDINDPIFNNRYLYTVSNYNLNIYNANDGSLYSSNTLKGLLKGKVSFKRYDLGYLIEGIESRNNDTFFVVLQQNSNTDLEYVVEYNLSFKNVVYYDMYFNTDYISILNSTGSIMILRNIADVDINGHISFQARMVNITLDVPVLTYSPTASSNPILMYIDSSNGHDMLSYAIPYNTATDISMFYGLFDLNTNTYKINPTSTSIIPNPATLNSNSGIYNINQAIVRHGSLTSADKIYIHFDGKFFYIGWNEMTGNIILSSSGTQLYNDDLSNFCAYDNSNLIFSDINYDNVLEMCVINLDACGAGNNYNLTCYNSLMSPIFTTPINKSNYLSAMKLTNSSYMNFMTDKYIIDYNGSLNKIYTFNVLDSYAIPISTIQKVNYSNDIVRFSTSDIEILQLLQSSVVCGDNVCSLSESPLTCPVDCVVAGNIPGTNTPLLITASYCTSNNQCISGFCDFNKCSLLSGGMSCLENSKCLSGVCSAGKCDNAGVSKNTKNLIQSLFGFSDADGVTFYLLVAAVIFILAGVFSVILMNIVPIISGLVLDLIILVGFTFTAITPGWLLLMVIIVLAFIAFILFMIFSRQQ